MQAFAKQFIADLHSAGLKPRGFTKRGHAFSRDRDAYVERIQVQGSSWNQAEREVWPFYLNAGVEFREFGPSSNRGFPGTHVYGRLKTFDEVCEDAFELYPTNAVEVRNEVLRSMDLALEAVAHELPAIHDAARRGMSLWMRPRRA